MLKGVRVPSSVLYFAVVYKCKYFIAQTQLKGPTYNVYFKVILIKLVFKLNNQIISNEFIDNIVGISTYNNGASGNNITDNNFNGFRQLRAC